MCFIFSYFLSVFKDLDNSYDTVFEEIPTEESVEANDDNVPSDEDSDISDDSS